MGNAATTGCATAEAALDFVRERGVVLASAKGPAPKLTEAILGAPIKGSWWAHPQSRRIYRVLEEVSSSEEVLVCRLIEGKITLVHRRLWPALVRLAARFARERLAKVRDEHTPSGRHETRVVAFPRWVPPDVAAEARAMSERDALAAFGSWLPPPGGR